MFCAIHLPSFPLQAALRHEPEAWNRPVAIVDSAGTTPRVIEATAPARMAGVVEGLTSPQALARCREVNIRSRSAAAEAAVTDAVLQCAYGFSPNLEVTGPGTYTLDLRGLAVLGNAAAARTRVAAEPPVDPAPETPSQTARLHAWAARLGNELAALRLRPSIGLGDTPNIARHAALRPEVPHPDPDPAVPGPGSGSGPGEPFVPIRHVTDPSAFVAGLPVAALDPSSDVEDLFRRWGIRTVGDMLGLGQAELAERLGLEALALFAAASVSTLRPLRLVQPPEHYRESFEFDPPVETLEPLLFLLRRFVDSLTRRLEPRGLAAGELILDLRLESGPALERRIRLPQPTRQPDILFRTLHTHLENLRAEAAIVAVTLALQPARPEQRQFSLFEAALRDPHQFQETLARLAALVGADRVGSPIRENSHRPDAFRLVPPDFENAPVPGPAAAGRRPALLQPTPVRRLRPPLEARVETSPDSVRDSGATPQPPLRLQCALIGGRLSVALGPWRSSGHWWDRDAWRREEWEVSLAHPETVLRLVHEGDAWRVEAVLD